MATNFTKGKIADVIAKDVANEIANAKNTLATFTSYLTLCASGEMQVDDARGLLLQRNRVLADARKRTHDPRPVAPLQDSRISEMKSILRLSKWKCWPTVLGYLGGMDVDREVLNTVSKFVRGKVKGEAKDSASAAPAREQVLRAIKARKASRRGTTTTNAKVATVRNPETNISVMRRNARGMGKWFGRSDGAQRFITALLNTLDSLDAAAKAKVKADAKAAEAAAA